MNTIEPFFRDTSYVFSTLLLQSCFCCRLRWSCYFRRCLCSAAIREFSRSYLTRNFASEHKSMKNALLAAQIKVIFVDRQWVFLCSAVLFSTQKCHCWVFTFILSRNFCPGASSPFMATSGCSKWVSLHSFIAILWDCAFVKNDACNVVCTGQKIFAEQAIIESETLLD